MKIRVDVSISVETGMCMTLGAAFYNTQGTAFVSHANTNSIDLNIWQHVAVTYNDQGDRKLHLYVNGQETDYQKQDTLTGTLKTTTNSLTIGNRIDTDRTFQGKIDGARIYNRALTQSEIQQIMSSTPDVTPTYKIPDFTQLATDWLKSISSPADITKDGIVDSRDLCVMMNNWKP